MSLNRDISKVKDFNELYIKGTWIKRIYDNWEA